MGHHAPVHFHKIANYESEFDITIHRTKSVNEQADAGTPYPSADQWMALALSEHFDRPFFMDKWELPAGAYEEGQIATA